MICGGHCPTELTQSVGKTGRGHTPEEKIWSGNSTEQKYALPSSIIKSLCVITFINKNICHGCVHKEAIPYVLLHPLTRIYCLPRFLFPDVLISSVNFIA
jgi:hypothetical protein